MSNSRPRITDESQRLRIARNIEVLRAYHDTTIQTLSDSLGLQANMFYRLKKMNYNVYEDEVGLIAGYFHLTLDDLVNKEVVLEFKKTI